MNQLCGSQVPVRTGFRLENPYGSHWYENQQTSVSLRANAPPARASAPGNTDRKRSACGATAPKTTRGVGTRRDRPTITITITITSITICFISITSSTSTSNY